MKYTHAILGGSGHIGTAITDILLSKGQTPLVIGHDPDKANHVKDFHYEVADVLDTGRLSELFGQAERLFILNPPASPDSNTDQVERAQIRSILDAIDGQPFKKIVAASTYGARRAEHLYDLGTLYDLEQGLAKLNLPLAIIRSAYYMSNFDQTIPLVKQKGELVTLFPKDLKLPMVAPADIGELAAVLLTDDRTSR